QTDQGRIAHGSHEPRTALRAPDAALGDGVVGGSPAAQAVGIERGPTVTVRPTDPVRPTAALRMAVPRLRGIRFRTGARGSRVVPAAVPATRRAPAGAAPS